MKLPLFVPASDASKNSAPSPPLKGFWKTGNTERISRGGRGGRGGRARDSELTPYRLPLTCFASHRICVHRRQSAVTSCLSPQLRGNPPRVEIAPRLVRQPTEEGDESWTTWNFSGTDRPIRSAHALSQCPPQNETRPKPRFTEQRIGSKDSLHTNQRCPLRLRSDGRSAT